jgi:hypothetical protein
MINELKHIELVSKALQMDTVTMASVRGLFDAIAKEYPVLEEKLSANSGIVLDKTFESAIVKIATGEN